MGYQRNADDTNSSGLFIDGHVLHALSSITREDVGMRATHHQTGKHGMSASDCRLKNQTGFFVAMPLFGIALIAGVASFVVSLEGKNSAEASGQSQAILAHEDIATLDSHIEDSIPSNLSTD